MCQTLIIISFSVSSQKVKHIPFQNEDLVVLVTNSNCRRSNAERELEQRRQTCVSAARKLGKKRLGELSIDELEGQHSHTHAHTLTHSLTERVCVSVCAQLGRVSWMV